ncbi:XRE family transcriptional regulator [Ktedonosporobacter rubrisoli]|uniref:XRE family transcriptional regulator n=1 Tax=Ktedonosporobacter rubrisoli TaxID=2509675 RepID=A0A4P6JZN3_KTERU|nr:helix-turn-helix transcriptional regulator [Ktedonosporobacter rubrisoli]QBD80870.1 XRE family transcriptional regulator [Ktedonosporobacter rubrisoli]
MKQLALEHHYELSAFLRSRRARISPEQVGLPRGMRRRTPGLRRAEVALLAGVTPEWYTWLEQGRDIHVSVQLLENLARILQLDANERAHLFLLALRQPPPVEAPSATISPTLQHFLDQLGTSPSCIVDARLNIVARNPAFLAVFGDAGRSVREQNLIWNIFTSPARQRIEDWEEVARVCLAQFRAEYARFIHDPWWARQIADLSRNSAEFRELWALHDVRNISEGHKAMHHPLAGKLSFDFLFFQTADSRDLCVLIHSPQPGSGTAAKIEQLLSSQLAVNA